jgi:ACR3 family arsenite efflux pump ArsB
MKNILLITALVFALILIFVLNLHKNVVATGENPFSLKNIIIVSVFFLIVVPLILSFQNLFRRYKKKKAERRDKNKMII